MDVSASLDGAALLTTGQMLAALVATLLLATLEVGCAEDGLREELRLCAHSWRLVLLSGVAHFLAIVSVNLALFHGTVTLVSIIKATELVFTAAMSRVALGHKPSTKQAGAGALLIVGLVALCVSDGGGGWGLAEGGAVFLALLSNVGNAARNVAMKGCAVDISSHVTLCLQSAISLVILTAVFVPLRMVWGAWDAEKDSGGGGGGGGRGGGGGGLAAAAAEMRADAAAALAASPGTFTLACVAFAVYIPTSQFVLRCCDSAVTHGRV